MVGALLCEPSNSECSAGVIFFNNVGYLGMCGHGTIGLVATLAYLGKLQPGPQRIETSVGVATASLNPDGSVTVINVPSYRTRSNVELKVAGHGRIVGDVAWGGNWFFLTKECPIALDMENVEQLTGTWHGPFGDRLNWKISPAKTARKLTTSNCIALHRRPTPIARTLCCAQVERMTGLLVAQAPAQKWPACMPMAN